MSKEEMIRECELRAEIERLRGFWQPIDTAPKDGTDILVWCGPSGDPLWGIAHWSEAIDPAYFANDPEGAAKNRDGWMMWHQHDIHTHDWPTHWTPLPPPPSFEQAEIERLRAALEKIRDRASGNTAAEAEANAGIFAIADNALK
jgi:hypothetical protein